MKILGLDFGKSKLGISVGDSETKFAEPLSVIRYKELSVALEKINQILQIENPKKVVIGISEGKSETDAKDFGRELSRKLLIPVTYYDETLSTADAIRLSVEAGIKRKERRELEDAYASAIMLQNYLEENFS